jgi:hypothetical protein
VHGLVETFDIGGAQDDTEERAADSALAELALAFDAPDGQPMEVVSSERGDLDRLA